MNNYVLKIKSSRYAILYPIVFFAATNMLVRSWVPLFYSSWGTLLFGCIISLFIVPQFLRTRWFLWICAYSSIITFNWYMGDKLFDAPLVTNEVANLFLFSSAIFYMICSDDVKCLKWTYWFLFFMVGIAAIGSLVVDQINPEIVRNQSRLVENNNMDILYGYYRMGLSNYLLPHAMPAIIPPLILLIKRNKGRSWQRLVAIAFLAFSLLLVYLGGSTAVLLMGVLALMCFFFGSDNRRNKKMGLVPVLLLLPFILFPELLVEIFSLFSGEIADTYGSHLKDLSDYSSSGTSGNMSTRMDLYTMSLGEFIKSPIWGTNDFMSNHSVMLDRLGTLGLLGFIPFIAIIVVFTRFVKKHLDNGSKIYFDMSVLVTFVMLISKGIEDKEIWLMFFVGAPVILYIAGAFKTNNNVTE